MADKPKDFTAQVLRLDRLRNSVNGNPRYRVTFDDGRMHVTMSDAAFCYAINNPELQQRVDVWLTGRGTIRHMAPAV